jgi:transposase-like protein
MARSMDSPKVLEWRRRLARFKDSRRSVVQFCRDEEVSVPSFYQWRKKLRQHTAAATETHGGERHGASDSVAGFTRLRVVASPCVTVRLPGGTQLEVPTADPAVLRRTIRLLAQVDARRVAGGESC